MKIGLVSDTHSLCDPMLFEVFSDVDEIWHAGDFGSLEVAERLAQFRPMRAVYGNIDGQDIRMLYPLEQRWQCEGMDIYMTHIGGTRHQFVKRLQPMLQTDPPQIFVCGHSHILQILRDPTRKNMLILNPGAAGSYGAHLRRTALRFQISQKRIHTMEAIDLGPRTKKTPSSFQKD